ncbi:hypothetical protein EVAR_41712_1 [Eumeta japonica]|uniref:Uncharacterized protein n=1 Tax=Eumeta variegata TaxID=151549 RepID=A0A4C1XI41_EUMVA|nr:hypothetical protein EVAR_41712_1 [Eumeta japonica]
MVRKFNVPVFTTYCGLGAERIGPNTVISKLLRESLCQRFQVVRRRSHLRHLPHHHNSNASKRSRGLLLVLRLCIDVLRSRHPKHRCRRRLAKTREERKKNNNEESVDDCDERA